MDHRIIGLLPSKAAVDFANACTGLFTAPEVERDLLKVPNSSLIEAVNFHAASVSTVTLSIVWFSYCSSFRILSHDFVF